MSDIFLLLLLSPLTIDFFLFFIINIYLLIYYYFQEVAAVFFCLSWREESNYITYLFKPNRRLLWYTGWENKFTKLGKSINNVLVTEPFHYLLPTNWFWYFNNGFRIRAVDWITLTTENRSFAGCGSELSGDTRQGFKASNLIKKKWSEVKKTLINLGNSIHKVPRKVLYRVVYPNPHMVLFFYILFKLRDKKSEEAQITHYPKISRHTIFPIINWKSVANKKVIET